MVSETDVCIQVEHRDRAYGQVSPRQGSDESSTLSRVGDGTDDGSEGGQASTVEGSELKKGRNESTRASDRRKPKRTDELSRVILSLSLSGGREGKESGEGGESHDGE